MDSTRCSDGPTRRIENWRGVGRRQQLGTEAKQGHDRRAGDQGGDQNYRKRSQQQLGDKRFECDAGAAGLRLVPSNAQKPAAQGGYQHDRHAEGGDEGDGHGERDAVDQAGGEALDEQHRQEYDAGGQRARRDGARDLARAADGRLAGRIARGETAIDGLDHHDGVVDQHSRAKGESAEGDDIEAVGLETHEEERREQRHRHRGRHDQDGAGGSQERRQYCDGEHDAHARGVLEMIQRVDDDAGVVRDFPHVDIRQVVVETAQGVANGRGHADRVGAGLLVDRKPDAFGSVDADEVIDFAVDEFDAAEVRHAHRLLPPGIVAQVAHDDVADVFHATKTRQGAELKDAVVFLQRARRNVDIFLGARRRSSWPRETPNASRR